MKILLSIGFLLTLTIFIILSLKVERDQINRVLSNRANRFKAHFFTFLINLLVILSYCILTLHFPIKMILASATIMFLMLFLWDVFSDSILGTNVPTIRKRIFFLVCFEGFKDGMQHPKKIDTTNIVTGTIIIASWLAALIIFWLNPVATESIRIVISILTIVNLIIAGNIVQILRMLPIVSAPYINDDVRNYNLIVGAFPNVVSSTVWLLFPIWVIYSSNGMFYNLPMWIIILIPLGALSIINVVPYFFGLQRHQFISKADLDIRIDLIARIRAVIALPESDIKNDLISNEIKSLNEQRMSELEDNQTVKAIQLLEANSQITAARNELGEKDMAMVEYLNKNKPMLSKLDIKLNHILELEEMEKTLRLYDSSKLKDYFEVKFESAMQEVERREKIRPYFLGVITTVITTFILFLFKLYNKEILQLLDFISS